MTKREYYLNREADLNHLSGNLAWFDPDLTIAEAGDFALPNRKGAPLTQDEWKEVCKRVRAAYRELTERDLAYARQQAETANAKAALSSRLREWCSIRAGKKPGVYLAQDERTGFYILGGSANLKARLIEVQRDCIRSRSDLLPLEFILCEDYSRVGTSLKEFYSEFAISSAKLTDRKWYDLTPKQVSHFPSVVEAML